MVFKKQQHCRRDCRIDRCARVVVQVDTPHGQNTVTLSASLVAGLGQRQSGGIEGGGLSVKAKIVTTRASTEHRSAIDDAFNHADAERIDSLFSFCSHKGTS